MSDYIMCAYTINAQDIYNTSIWYKSAECGGQKHTEPKYKPPHS